MNYCDDLIRQCASFRNKPLVSELETGRKATFGELYDQVLATATFLKKRGIGPGKSVVIHLFNGIDAMVLHLATQYVGARSCFVDALVQPKSLDYYAQATSADLFVTRVPLSQLPSDLLARTEALFADELPRIAIEHAAIAEPPYDWSGDEVAYVYFTSGTTSEPKGVMLSLSNHQNFTRICSHYWQPVTDSSKHLCFVPFSHGFGTVFLVPLALRTASELYLLRAFHPLRVSEAIEHHGITHLYGVPSHYQQLLRLPHAHQHLAHLKMAFCAAAKLPHELMLEWEKTTGIILCEGYGLIETCCGTVWRVGTPSLGTGHMGPCPDPALVEIGIFDAELQPLPREATGQIAVRGPSIMKGYLNQPEETARVMHDGWFLTGDQGHITNAGELFMTGRIKDIINIAGIKVSPYEVEAVLHQHPAVLEAAVVAAPDPLYGEVVKAYVRPRPSAELTERDLIRFAAERLINFQVPKHVEFVESFPLNSMGKLDRKKLRADNPL
jgi:long-chain acyl-CoA synthetase